VGTAERDENGKPFEEKMARPEGQLEGQREVDLQLDEALARNLSLIRLPQLGGGAR